LILGTLKLRSYQENLVNFIVRSLGKEGGAVIEAPTGSGKTIVGLLSALTYQKKNGGKILYLTRTNSQQEQVLRELRKLSGSFNISAVPLQGRKNLCILSRELYSGDDLNAETLSRFCSLRKKKVAMGQQNACVYFNDRLREPDVKKYIFDNIPSAEDFYEYCARRSICPYEALKYAMKSANIVIAPYSSFISQPLSEKLLYNWGAEREDLTIILDEAHNLPFIARDSLSYVISVKQIDLAEREAYSFGDDELTPGIKATDFTDMLRNAILSMVHDMLVESDEIRVRFEDFAEYIMIQNHITSEKFKTLSDYFYYLGEKIIELKNSENKVPSSHVLSLGSRLLRWESNDVETSVAILSRDRDGMLEAFNLDPSVALIPLKRSRTIHMSGTLQPVDVYKNITGFRNLPSRVIKNIFPAENRMIIYNDDVTTKFSEFTPSEAERIHDLIENIITSVRRNTLVFFSSYSNMEAIISKGFSFPIQVERRNLSLSELNRMIRSFRKSGGAFFAVTGGRVSEGVNFPGEELEMVILAGVPYPRPDARQKAIQDYYEFRFHNGWEYAVTFPTAVRMRQEIGRLIRSEKDVGMAIILDHRASHFRRYIPGMRLSKDPVLDAVNFFASLERG